MVPGIVPSLRVVCLGRNTPQPNSGLGVALRKQIPPFSGIVMYPDISGGLQGAVAGRMITPLERRDCRAAGWVP